MEKLILVNIIINFSTDKIVTDTVMNQIVFNIASVITTNHTTNI